MSGVEFFIGGTVLFWSGFAWHKYRHNLFPKMWPAPPEGLVEELYKRIRYHKNKARKSARSARSSYMGLQHWRTKYLEEVAKNETNSHEG